MGFPSDEVQRMLAIKGVGPTVIRRLEEIGFSSLAELAGTNPLAINKTVAEMLHASCWANSPLAKNAIAAVVDLANAQHPAPPA
jgi:nucleotidyltransferase/DNA polymerase involved in DNA repair